MKTLVVYHHVPIREALRGVLKELRNDVTVLEAADSREAMRLIEEHPDLGLIVLNLDLPDRDGFSVLSEICMNHPAISVVVMSAQEDYDSVVKALNQGALGFIPKSATREVILGAMWLVISGGVYIPPQTGVLRVDRKRPRDGDLPEAPLPAVPPSPTKGPQGKRRRKSQGFLTAQSNRSAADEPADEAGA
jgi:DNA-binding NarL/FixJ family response regulator